MTTIPVQAVYFDLGGVYYTEGFREGLFKIAGNHGLDRQSFYEIGTRVIFDDGYVRGEAPERTFWDQLAGESGLTADLYPERETILSSFRPQDGMIPLVEQTREHVPVGLLTDQSNWIYELDERDGLLSSFDAVVNSYEEGYTKRDSEIFRIACQRLDVLPEEILFFDDSAGNVGNAREFGIRAHLFEDAGQVRRVLKREQVIP